MTIRLDDPILKAEVLAYALDHSDRETALKFNVSHFGVRRLRKANNIYRPRALAFPKVCAPKLGREKARYLESEKTRLIYSDKKIRFGKIKTCQYIGETGFCGKPVKSGSSYCPEHHAICWRGVPERKMVNPAF